MDRGPSVSGKKLLVGVIGGLILFTLVSMFITFAIGNYFGHVKNKKLMEEQRQAESQRMIERESEAKH